MEVRTRFAKIELPFFFVIQTSQNQSGYNLHRQKNKQKTVEQAFVRTRDTQPRRNDEQNDD